MQRNWILLAIAVGAVGLVATSIFGALTGGGAQTIGVTVGLTVTAYFVLLMIYFAQREPQADQPTPVAEAAPVAEPTPATPTVAISAKPATDNYYDFKGDIHDIIDVEGIGPVYAERLMSMGIPTTAHLCYRDATEIAEAIGAPVKTVAKWQAMAQLAKINGVGKQYAEAMVRAGIDSIDTLKRRNPAAIARQVTSYLESLDNNVLGQKVTERRVERWQENARTMRRVRQPVPA